MKPFHGQDLNSVEEFSMVGVGGEFGDIYTLMTQSLSMNNILME